MKFKQLIIGIVIGAVLMFSGQVMADSISKVGKKVQAEYVVKVDGLSLETKGLSIDGQTTVPARALADAVGYSVAFKNKEVILTKKEQEEGPKMIELEKRKLQDELNGVLGSIEDMEFFIRIGEEQLTIEGIHSTEEVRKNAEKQLADYKTKLAELQKQKTELEAQLEALK